MSVRRIVLAPLAWLYGAALLVRHALYDAGVLRSVRPAVPTIAIGNLAFGGTGKTPMLELVLRTLQDSAPLAALSRGYGRHRNEVHEVAATDTADVSGDEPVQVKRKFPAVRVFVGADRVRAIAHMEQVVPGLRAVVLDDALQHRRLNAGLNLLLTTYQRPWCSDALFPAGHLRDLPDRHKAAHIVVVTKCPARPTPDEQREWRERLGLRDDQELFFSGIVYEALSRATPGSSDAEGPTSDPGTTNFLLVTGIADPGPLAEQLRARSTAFEHITFPDHHAFTSADLARIAARYATFAAGPKTLVTTEKDAVRLLPMIAGSPLEQVPLATIGMRAEILNTPERFAELIRRHVGTHPAHR
jgi:tetraacyldisaccharide 4'-kinase